jgi:RHS repeat-associated protein
MEADKSGRLNDDPATPSVREGIRRHDYAPFGEEIYAGIRQSGGVGQYGYEPPQSNVRIKFGSKERDSETGLDFFEARYFSSTQGRFTSPDEFTGGPTELFAEVAAHNPTFYADIVDPQSLNKYGYCLNNPFKFVDPDGHQARVSDVLKFWGTISACQSCQAEIGKGVAKEIANIFIGVKNTDPFATERTAYYEPDNIFQDFGMTVTEHVSIIGSFLGKGGPVNVATAEAGPAARVAAEAEAVTAPVRTYQTYTKVNEATGEVYAGRTSGTGTPQQNLARRDSSHARNLAGFGPAKLDQSSTNKAAIRGREQQLIDKNRQQGTAAKQINGISPRNKNRQRYLDAATKAFGEP